MSAKALEFAILTAARSAEVLKASWGEVDMAERVWTVPASRMKAGREHRVPLSDAALAVLADMATIRTTTDPAAPVFPGTIAGKGLSVMALDMLLRRMNKTAEGEPAPWLAADGRAIVPHGFRSTFRDWASEATAYPREVAEMALAHAVGNAVEAAYRRGDLFAKRARMMDDWAAYCAKGAGAEGENVTPIRPALAEVQGVGA